MLITILVVIYIVNLGLEGFSRLGDSPIDPSGSRPRCRNCRRMKPSAGAGAGRPTARSH
jgi:hypothetical protein